MTNARGSKSARPPKAPKTPAKGGAPEVAIANGTTAVLPSPADAPAPKAGRKKKPEPSVATKAELPDWAKRAAARDTAAEMASVAEAAPVAEPEPTPPTPKKGSASKAAKPATKAATPTAKPGSLRAIGNAWIESIRAAGHSVSTVSSYANDLEVAYEVLDGNAVAADLTERQIAGFNESKAVLKKANGKPKAKPTILKTRRALRLALVWAAQTGLIKKAPIPAKTPA